MDRAMTTVASSTMIRTAAATAAVSMSDRIAPWWRALACRTMALDSCRSAWRIRPMV
jgi:hypothetical protein